MKYPLPSEGIPKALRAEINQKILLMIGAGQLQGITHAQIFQAYTGNGGLHGLEAENFESYHSFSKAKKEIEQGQFFTHPALCKEIVDSIPVSGSDMVADITCGSGNFFNFMPNEKNCYGCEIDPAAHKVASFLYPDATIEMNDIRFYKPEHRFDIIVGNPPFNLMFQVGKEKIVSQLFFLIKAHELLSSAGMVVFIAPESFLADSFSDKHLIAEVNKRFNFLAQAKLPKGAFKQMGVTSFGTKVVYLQKREANIEHRAFEVGKFIPFQPLNIRNQVVSPALEFKYSIRHKLLYSDGMETGSNNYSVKNSGQRPNDGFDFMLKKILFEIRHQAGKSYSKAMGIVEEFRTQERPDGMSYEEWESKKLTQNKVLASLKRMLKTALHPGVKKTGFSIIKSIDGITVRAHDQASREFIKARGLQTYFPFSELLHSTNANPFMSHPLRAYLTPYLRLVNRKRRLVAQQQKPFSQLKSTQETTRFMGDFTFMKKDSIAYRLNDVQKQDLVLTALKPFGSILNWQQGSGKTASGFAVLKYRQSSFRNAVIVGPPISIQMTWIPFLTLQNEKFIVIETFEDFQKIEKGHIVVIAITKVSTLYRHLRLFLRGISFKAMLLFDESDEVSNYSAKRSRAMRLFKKVKYKLLTTGTISRNNLQEMYGQLELIFNNSSTFLSKSDLIYREKRTDEGTIIVPVENDHKGKPFSGRTGYSLFKHTFSPTKATVFGIGKHNQDIYNRPQLEEVIQATVQTRKFKDIVGGEKYELISHTIPQSNWEKDFYGRVLERFSEILPSFYGTTGNTRKDAMLRIIRQLNTLIKACSIPNLMSGNASYPNKTTEIISLIDGNNERTMIGCTTKRGAKFYHDVLTAHFPGRTVFLITGETGHFSKRQAIIDRFEATADGILVCTQQSLSSSVSIPSCNEVIIESLRYNLPRCEQFYFRTVRYDSTGKSRIHFVIYENSIEVNLMTLLADKERMNDFIKTLEFRAINEVFQDFSLNIDFLDMLITRVTDDNTGLSKLSWGKQKVIS